MRPVLSFEARAHILKRLKGCNASEAIRLIHIAALSSRYEP
jgi:hypothetical protein